MKPRPNEHGTVFKYMPVTVLEIRFQFICHKAKNICTLSANRSSDRILIYQLLDNKHLVSTIGSSLLSMKSPTFSNSHYLFLSVLKGTKVIRLETTGMKLLLLHFIKCLNKRKF